MPKLSASGPVWTVVLAVAIVSALPCRAEVSRLPYSGESSALVACGSTIYVYQKARPLLAVDPLLKRLVPKTLESVPAECRPSLEGVRNGVEPRFLSAAGDLSFRLITQPPEVQVYARGRMQRFGIPLASSSQLGWETRAPAIGPTAAAPSTQTHPEDMFFANAFPHPEFVTTSKDGAAWIEMRGFADDGSYLARFSPVLHMYSLYPLFLVGNDAFLDSAAGLAVDSSDGAWVMGGSERYVVRIGPFGDIRRLTLPGQKRPLEDVSATGQLARDASDRIWFVQSRSGQVGYVGNQGSPHCSPDRLPGANQIVAIGQTIAVLNSTTSRLLLISASATTRQCLNVTTEMPTPSAT